MKNARDVSDESDALGSRFRVGFVKNARDVSEESDALGLGVGWV